MYESTLDLDRYANIQVRACHKHKFSFFIQKESEKEGEKSMEGIYNEKPSSTSHINEECNRRNLSTKYRKMHQELPF